MDLSELEVLVDWDGRILLVIPSALPQEAALVLEEIEPGEPFAPEE